MSKLKWISGLAAVRLNIPNKSLRVPRMNGDAYRIDARCLKRYQQKIVKA